eukprot:1003946_1
MTRFMNAFTLPAIVLVLVQLSVLPHTSANPSQAGHCNKGSISDQGDWTGPHNSQGGGGLEDGSYQITIDGVALDIFNTAFIDVGKDYIVRLETLVPDDLEVGYFRGALIRLDTSIVNNGLSVSSDDFTVQPSDSGIIQKHPFCEADDIPAITHTSRDKKTVIEFTMNVSVPISGLRLDTTVVRNKEDGGSNWYYDRYNLNSIIVDPPPPPCIEKSLKKFYLKTTKNGKVVNKSCNWLAKKNEDSIENICAMTVAEGSRGLAKDVCQATCETCPSACFQASGQKFFYKMRKGKPLPKNCQWLSKRTDNQIAKICSEKNLDPSGKYPPAMTGCPVTCESC